jgi:hypothetical protein
MAEVTYIRKGGQYSSGTGNKKTEYAFRKYEDVAAALGMSFRKNKIFVESRTISSSHEMEQRPYASGSGYTVWTSVFIEMAYTFISLVDGSTVTVSAFGEGKDNSDKATAKAMTTAMKAALTQGFMIATDDPDPDASRPGDDGDFSQPVGQGRPPQNQRQAPPSQPPAQPEMPQADQRMNAARWFVQAMNQPGITLEQLNKLIGNAKKRSLGGVEVDGVKLAVRFASVGATLGQRPDTPPNDAPTYDGPPEPDHGGY